MSEASPRKSSAAGQRAVDGIFFRIVFATDADDGLAGARAPEGRFHHAGEAALYLSPTVAWAKRAIAPYRTVTDPPRVAVPLRIERAVVVDLRDTAACAARGIDPADAAKPWQPQRRNAQPADSWRVADAVRVSGVDGMICPARSSAGRWHIVLFRWNAAGAARVSVAGAPVALAADHPIVPARSDLLVTPQRP